MVKLQKIRADEKLTQERVRDLFVYNQETGNLVWKKRTSNRVAPGRIVSIVGKNGYIEVAVDGIRTYAHRVAFLWMTGSIPRYIDHIDGDRSNNSWINLRECTQSQNLYNARLRKDNSSGVKNVYFIKNTGKWAVKISLGGRTRSFGHWDDFEAAELVSILAREKFIGGFANHG